MKIRRIWLAVWLAGILFPMGMLRQFSPAFRSRFDAIFSPEWMHVLMHALLFAMLVLLISFAFNFHPRRKTAIILLLLLLAGLFQEGLQWVTHSTLPGWNSLFDLAVDLCGGTLGLAIDKLLGRAMIRG